MNGKTEITGVQLRSEGDALLVEIQVEGHWYIVIRERLALGEQSVSHGVAAYGLERVIEGQQCRRCRKPLNNVSPGYSVTAAGYVVCTPCLRPGEERLRARSVS